MMRNILPAAALVISILALLFGGYFNTQWDRSVNRGSVIPSIIAIKHGPDEHWKQEIKIPGGLQRESEEALYFPTLPDKIYRDDLEKIIEDINLIDFELASANLRLISNILDDRDTPDEKIRQIWNDLAPENKAVLFAIRTSSLIEEKITPDTDLDEDQIAEIINRFVDLGLDTDASTEERFFDDPIVRKVLGDVVREVAQAELVPTREFLKSLIKPEYILQLNRIASENKNLRSKISDLIESNHIDKYVLEITVRLYNKGGRLASLSPAAVMAIQKNGQLSRTVFMHSENIANIVIPPGEGADIIFRAEDEDKLGKFLDEEDQDYKVVFKYLDGRYVESRINRFSRIISDELRREMIEYAKESNSS